ncbi:MAG TPA: S-adenosyl-l-methionine hydroxide adenosyltransferase family protein [Gemmatimonadales bacterium]|nr:S-adenosyl-l-methionine hydroxide adenosyltransferase family protein [Gemmatimonadales bacterium]
MLRQASLSLLLLVAAGRAGVAQAPLVLQTDFGLTDGSVAAMKGVALSIAPGLQVHDLTHLIPPYDVREAALRLRQALRFWPRGTVFVSVVDPGVGTDRRAIVARTRSGHYIVTPDNGTLTFVADAVGLEAVREIDVQRHARGGSERSFTFQGRDLFVVVGAGLAAGILSLNDVGAPVDQAVARLPLPPVRRNGSGVTGAVIGIDRPFGNVWTNLPAALLDSVSFRVGDTLRVTVRRGPRLLFQGDLPFARTFGDVAPGRPLLYLNSLLDAALALNRADFAGRYTIVPGDEVELKRR